MTQAKFEDWKDRAERYERGLRRIAETMGRVCPNFELCKHESCMDSCGAVLVALNLLNGEEATV